MKSNHFYQKENMQFFHSTSKTNDEEYQKAKKWKGSIPNVSDIEKSHKLKSRIKK